MSGAGHRARAATYGSIERALASSRSAGACRAVLLVAAAIYAVLALWLTRGTTYGADELSWFADADGYSPGSILEPYNAHLIGVTRLLYASATELFGTDHLPIAAATIAAVIGSAALLFAFVERRLGPIIALAASLPLLFMGSTPVTLVPSYSGFAQATAFGVAALIALERRTMRADVAACVALLLSVASLEIGVAFAICVAVWLALEPESRRRIWVAVVPLAAYGAWWLWARQFDQGIATGSILLTPGYAADSLAATVGAMSGLSIAFGNATPDAVLDVGWARPLAAAVVVLVALRVRRVGCSPLWIGLLGMLVVLWAAGAIGESPLRPPEASRYAFSGALLVILLLAETLRGARITPPMVLAIVALLAVALPANLLFLRDRGTQTRDASVLTRASLAIIELERERVPDNFNGGLELPVRMPEYLAAVERIGPLGFTTAQLRAEAGPVRAQADEMLDRILLPRVVEAPASPGLGCRRVSPATDPTVTVPLPPGGAVLRAQAGTTVRLRRFGDEFSIEAGVLPGAAGLLPIPVDADPTPWVASLDTAGPVRLCPAGTAT